MYSPAIGIGYALWLKARWLISGMLAFILLMGVALRLNLLSDVKDQIICGSMALVFAWAPLLNILIFSPTDLGSKGSAYPKHMLVLPLRTRALIGWPMFYGVIVQALIWTLLAGLVLIPSGIPAPYICPIAILATITTWVQAIAWSAIPSPYARAPLLVAAIVPIVALWVWVGYYPHNVNAYAIGTIGTLILLAIAFCIGVFGLSLARAGKEFEPLQFFADRFTQLIGKQSIDAPKLRAPFTNADAALQWYDRRRNVPYLPMMVSLIALPLVAVMCSEAVHSQAHDGLMLRDTFVPTAVLGLAALLAVTLTLSFTAGGYMAKSDFFGKIELTAFYAIRPMPTARMIGNKFKAAAIAALAAWAIVLFVLVVWAAVEASPLNPGKSTVRNFFAEASLGDFAAVICIFLGLLAFIWRNLVVGMWPTLSGRSKFSTILAIISILTFCVAPGVVHWISLDAARKAFVVDNAIWFLAIAVAIKLCAAVAIGTALHRRQLMSDRTIATAFTIWLTIVAGLIALLAFFATWSWYFIPAAILPVPLVRIGAAPLALDWNRHR